LHPFPTRRSSDLASRGPGTAGYPPGTGQRAGVTSAHRPPGIRDLPCPPRRRAGEPESARFIPRASDDPTIVTSPEVPGPGSPLAPGASRGSRAVPPPALEARTAARCAIVIGSVVDGRDVAQFGSALD